MVQFICRMIFTDLSSASSLHYHRKFLEWLQQSCASFLLGKSNLYIVIDVSFTWKAHPNKTIYFFHYPLSSPERRPGRIISEVRNDLKWGSNNYYSWFLDRVCGIHHLERPAAKWNLQVCLWFVVVTFSTVGYGEYTPNDWPAQTFVMIMIAIALILLPVEVGSVEKLSGIVICSGMFIPLMRNCHTIINTIRTVLNLSSVRKSSSTLF